MAEADLPSTWSKALQNLHGNSLWILPLVAIERALDGHPYHSAIAGVIWLVAACIAVKFDVLKEIASDHERRQQLLTWALILAGAILLGAGIYRLAANEQRPNGPATVTTTDEDIAKATTPIRAELENVRREWDATKSELEITKRHLQDARNAGAITGSDPATQGPITWRVDSQLMVVSGGAPNAVVNGLLFFGTSTTSVSIKEAYVVSGLTGRKQALMANVQSKGAYYPVDQVDIPPNAPVQLDLIFNPALPFRDFLDQWGKFRVTVVYSNGALYERDYDEAFVRQKLADHVPNAFGPRVTPRNDK